MRRIHSPLTESHLKSIKDAALKELNRFYTEVGEPPGKYSVYKDKLVGVFLCQGAAQHYFDTSLQKSEIVDRDLYISEDEVLELEDKLAGIKFDNEGNILSGIQDIDIWFFFHNDPNIAIPHIRNCKMTGEVSLEGIGDIRVDFMKKTISKKVSESITDDNITTIVKAYLKMLKPVPLII